MGIGASNVDILDDFKVTKDKSHELGRGAYGTVYRGVRVSNKEPVAVKIMTGYKEQMNLEELEKEKLVMSKIPEHKNIVTMHAYRKKEYEEDGVVKLDLWLVMERCTDRDLQKYAGKEELFMKQKIDLMYQAACAVQHLHNCKPEPIAHRDVKPENLLITKIDSRIVVKLCDFGCARAVFQKDGRSVTMKSLAGTAKFWAPEQHAYDPQDVTLTYDKSVDTFSLGVTNLALLECTKGSIMAPRKVEGKVIGRFLYDMHTGNSRHSAINIDSPTDCKLVSNVKRIIKDMIEYTPADRINMDEVVSFLSVLRDSELDSVSDEVLLAVNEGSMWVRVGSAWEKQPCMPHENPYRGVCFCRVFGGIVAAGGSRDGTVSSVCHLFSVKTRRWKRLPDMATARCAASAVAVGQILLVLGGWDKPSHYLAVCERYHLTDNMWNTAPSMMEPLSKPLVATLAGLMYIVPHAKYMLPMQQDIYTSSVPLRIQQYDPKTNSFSWAAQLPKHVETWGACLVAADDKLYLFGGRQRLAIEYSPAADQWTQLSQIPGRNIDWGCCGVVHDGRLLLCGRSTDGNDRNLVEEFQSTKQQWKTADINLPFAFSWYNSHVASICV